MENGGSNLYLNLVPKKPHVEGVRKGPSLSEVPRDHHQAAREVATAGLNCSALCITAQCSTHRCSSVCEQRVGPFWERLSVVEGFGLKLIVSENTLFTLLIGGHQTWMELDGTTTVSPGIACPAMVTQLACPSIRFKLYNPDLGRAALKLEWSWEGND